MCNFRCALDFKLFLFFTCQHFTLKYRCMLLELNYGHMNSCFNVVTVVLLFGTINLKFLCHTTIEPIFSDNLYSTKDWYGAGFLCRFVRMQEKRIFCDLNDHN